MADTTSLVERYRGATDQNASEQVRSEILRSQAPDLSRFPAMRGLDIKATALQKKAVFEGQAGAFEDCLKAIASGDVKVARYAATLVYDMLREDNSCFAIIEDALSKGTSVMTLSTTLTTAGADQYVADRAAWLLSATIGNTSRFFEDQQVKATVQSLQRAPSPCSELGVLEAYVNLLKADRFRDLVWTTPGVSEIITGVSAASAPPAYLYKCVFAMWLMSFGDSQVDLHPEILVRKIKEILSTCRVEKVIRLALTVMKNFLGQKAFSEQVVEQGVLEVVQQLEFEKWRETELYDDIRELCSQISLRVGEMSNYDRYLKELNEGALKWGFIHSAKFWADNVLKFEQNDYRALKDLAKLLQSRDPTTLAVACHDLGEFVVCHPLGKKLVTDLGVKEPVMSLMSSTSPELREVRREALLCCQKFMLNKWGDMDNLPA